MTQQQQDETDGAPDERAGDPRERAELARITGDEYVDAPAAEGDQAASDDAPLRSDAEREG